MSGGVSYVRGVGNTRFGRLPGGTPLTLMAQASDAALDDAQLGRRDIDGVLCGYATTLPHLMLADRFCEFASLQPAYAHGMAGGGPCVCQRDATHLYLSSPNVASAVHTHAAAEGSA